MIFDIEIFDIEDNYRAKLLRLISEGKIPIEAMSGGLWHIDVAHDGWCGVYRHEKWALNENPTDRPF
jgi:hypothetical protein